MATIRERPRKTGGITYTVLWRAGGTRDGKQESENFPDDPRAAEVFKGLVDMHAQQWPPGWVRGQGFVQAMPARGKDQPFAEWAHRVVDRLTGIEERTRGDYHRDIDNHFAGVLVHAEPSGRIVAPTVANVTAADVTDWVRAQEDGKVRDGDPEQWERQPAAPKSISNRHGLLYGIFQAAIEAEPPLRSANPCAKTKLPRIDSGTEDEMVFLEHTEWQRLRAEIASINGGDGVDIADVLVATGLRWGELAALQVRDLNLAGSNPTLRVARAWKRQRDNSLKLGPPKTKKSRRTLALSAGTVEILRRNVVAKSGEDFVFTTAWGNPWRHSNYYNRRWLPAVRAAQTKGLPKAPRLHDLRHTHVSWLIAKNIPLPAIQARLGHESITTTVDRYGHLVRALDGEIVAAIQAAMAADDGPGLRLVERLG
ncbi:site-specific integrase [Streptomyces tateyamensis]|uniref:Site-specific integrase n=1 Tax=Streptomyces tateyamensis TaxID=565073 RepID=A0A2V4PDU3_9ACTN|nr:site-specific integrase [Streptomyces tateyamensis]PYC83421.1 site-specific integrase [Streptomyces tateyamensis]